MKCKYMADMKNSVKNIMLKLVVSWTFGFNKIMLIWLDWISVEYQNHLKIRLNFIQTNCSD